MPTSANVEYYAHIVARTATARRLIDAAGQIAAIAYNDPDTGLALEQAEKQLASVRARAGLAASALTSAQTVVLVLRLLNSQPVGLSGYHWQPVDQPFLLFPRHSSSFNFNEPPMAYVGMPYVLTSSDADRLAALWPRVQRAKRDDLLTVASTRLADSYLRSKNEDRLIDYWTALESLFLQSLSLSGGGSQVQQGTLVAAALARYIGATASERAGIASTVVDSHGLRGAVIHADKKKNWRPDKITELVTKTGEYLRAALRKRIQE